MDASGEVAARVSPTPVKRLSAFHFHHLPFCRAGKLWRRPLPHPPAKSSAGPLPFPYDFLADFQPTQPASPPSVSHPAREQIPLRICSIPNAPTMNGITQTQIQRSKLPAGPPPVNVPPAPPAQKPTPGHPHTGHPHPRPNQHPTPQLPPNRGQPSPNAQHPKNKKKAEPVPVDPAVMYESLKSRIAALEEEETHEEEEERRFGTCFTTPTLYV